MNFGLLSVATAAAALPSPLARRYNFREAPAQHRKAEHQRLTRDTELHVATQSGTSIGYLHASSRAVFRGKPEAMFLLLNSMFDAPRTLQAAAGRRHAPHEAESRSS